MNELGYQEYTPPTEGQRSETEILDNLVSLKPIPENISNAGDALVKTVLNDPAVQMVVLYGEPGIGKTTIAGQLMKRIKQESHLGIETAEDHSYEALVQTFEYPYTHYHYPRKDWTAEYWEAFSEALTHIYAGKLDEDKENGKRKVRVATLVGVGKLDRAKSTLNTLSGDSRILLCGISGDHRNQMQAAQLRYDIGVATPPEEVERKLNETYGVIVEIDDPTFKNRGDFIRTTVRRMAPEDGIMRIHREVQIVTNQALAELAGKPLTELHRRFRLLPPDQILRARENQYRLQTEYNVVQMHMRDQELSMYAARPSFALYNPYYKGLKRWYIHV